jgi:Fic family protein
MKLPELPPSIKHDALPIEKMLELFKNIEINKKLSQLDGGDYPYWNKFKYKTEAWNVDSKTLWIYNKLLRAKSQVNISICKDSDFQFKINSTSKILKYLHEFDMNLGGLLEGGAIIPPEDKNRFLISSIMEEAIASSQLEGAVTTREVAKEMLKSERKPRNHSEKMILNNYLTIKKIADLKDKKISKELIKEIHSTIVKETLENSDNEGIWRINNKVNVVDSSTDTVVYTPPSFEKIDELMDAFCDFANSDSTKDTFIHPIVKAIILHFLIGYIHPFVDGNGRTARAIFYWYLISKGYWLVEYLSISRIIVKSPIKYAKAYLYTEYDENDLTYFVYYNLRAMHIAMQDLQNYIGRKIDEKKSVYSLIKFENINERQAEILKELINFPDKAYSIKEIQNQFAIAYQTARTDLMGLVTLEYLSERLMGKKILFFKSKSFDAKIKKINLM